MKRRVSRKDRHREPRCWEGVWKHLLNMVLELRGRLSGGESGIGHDVGARDSAGM